MSILDKGYKFVKLDLNKKTYSDLNMRFYISDKQTSDFYISITKNLEDIDLKDKKVELIILNPNKVKTKQSIEYKEDIGLYYCNLSNTNKNITGKYTCQVSVSDDYTLEKTLTNKFNYYVEDDLENEGKEPENTGSFSYVYDADSKKVTLEGISSSYADNKLSLEV